MSLDFDYAHVNMENFPDLVVNGKSYVNVKLSDIVWAMLEINQAEISEETVEEVWFRVDFYQRLSGGSITAIDIHNAIGLRTNVGDKSRGSFMLKMRGLFGGRWHLSVAETLSRQEKNNEV